MAVIFIKSRHQRLCNSKHFYKFCNKEFVILFIITNSSVIAFNLTNSLLKIVPFLVALKGKTKRSL